MDHSGEVGVRAQKIGNDCSGGFTGIGERHMRLNDADDFERRMVMMEETCTTGRMRALKE